MSLWQSSLLFRLLFTIIGLRASKVFNSLFQSFYRFALIWLLLQCSIGGDMYLGGPVSGLTPVLGLQSSATRRFGDHVIPQQRSRRFRLRSKSHLTTQQDISWSCICLLGCSEAEFRLTSKRVTFWGESEGKIMDNINPIQQGQRGKSSPLQLVWKVSVYRYTTCTRETLSGGLERGILEGSR